MMVFVQIGMSGAKAACSERESPSDCLAESTLVDLHVLRQGFIPPNPG